MGPRKKCKSQAASEACPKQGRKQQQPHPRASPIASQTPLTPFLTPKTAAATTTTAAAAAARKEGADAVKSGSPCAGPLGSAALQLKAAAHASRRLCCLHLQQQQLQQQQQQQQQQRYVSRSLAMRPSLAAFRLPLLVGSAGLLGGPPSIGILLLAVWPGVSGASEKSLQGGLAPTPRPAARGAPLPRSVEGGPLPFSASSPESSNLFEGAATEWLGGLREPDEEADTQAPPWRFVGSSAWQRGREETDGLGGGSGSSTQRGPLFPVLSGGGLEALEQLSMHDADSQPAFNEEDETSEQLRSLSFSEGPFEDPYIASFKAPLDATYLAAQENSEAPALEGGAPLGPPPLHDARESETSGPDQRRLASSSDPPLQGVGNGQRHGSGGSETWGHSSSARSSSAAVRSPHEYYLDSRDPPPVKGLRWAPDPRVLHPELLRDLAWWQSIYGFNRELTVSSTVRKGLRYKIAFTDILGSGGIGVVFSAVDLTNKRRIAVKVCRLQKPTNRGQHYVQEVLRRRTQEEISLWKHVPQSIGTQQWSKMSHVVIPLDVVQPLERLATNDEAIKFSFEWIVLDLFAAIVAFVGVPAAVGVAVAAAVDALAAAALAAAAAAAAV
ncbi:hypothetical protein Emag_006221 [Eimeria magna]